VEDFTPISGLIGGLLIGLATTLMLLNDRITGISGIVSGLLARKGSEGTASPAPASPVPRIRFPLWGGRGYAGYCTWTSEKTSSRRLGE
jgi:uncharacterized membrane protein YedE/YeeE